MKLLAFLLLVTVRFVQPVFAQEIKDQTFLRLEKSLKDHFAQKTMDSIITIVHAQNRRAKKLNNPFYKGVVEINYANYYRYKGIKDSIKFHVDNAENFFGKQKPSRWLLRTKKLRIDYISLFEHPDNMDSLIQQFHILSKKVGNKKFIYISHTLLSKQYITSTKYDKGLEELLQAEKIWNSFSKSQKNEIPPPYSNFGYLYYKMRDFEKLIEPIEKLVSYYANKGDYWSAAQQSNNVASSYVRSRDDTTSFINALHRSINYARKANFKYGEANACNQLASHYVSNGQTDSANYYIVQLYKAVPVIEELDFKALVCVLQARYYEMVGDAFNCEIKYKQAHDLWKLLKEIGKQKEMADILTDLNEKSGDTKDAFNYLKISYELQKELVDKREIERVKELELTSNFRSQQLADSLKSQSEKQQIIFDNEQKTKEKEAVRNYLILGIIIVLILTFFVLFAYRRKRRESILLNETNELISKNLEEKQLLLKEIHHRVKNNFQIVSSLIKLQSKTIDDPKYKELAKDGENRIKAMALIHQKLYQNEDLTIEMNDYIDVLVKNISSVYQLSNVDISTSVSYSFTVDIDTAIPLGLILNELITNAFKYAFNKSGGNHLKIELVPSDVYHVLTVSDSGEGIPESTDIETTPSLGLRLVKRLTRQLSGKMEYKNENGAVFTILFKDTVMRSLVD